MTPREELLSTRTLGPAGVALLYKTVGQVARVRGLPPPVGHDRWDDDAVLEAGNAVFVERTGIARFYELAVASHDDSTFRSRLWTAVYRSLVDQGRRTERGRLALRLQEELNRLPGCRHSGDVFILDNVLATQLPVRLDELVQAASRVPVNVPAWSDDAAREAPFADRDSIVGLLRAILELAPDGLRFAEIVDVVGVRLGVHDSATPLDQDSLGTHLGPHPVSTGALVENRSAAVELLDQLTPEQQLVLPFLDGTVTDIVNGTGLKRNKAWRIHGELKDRLRELLTEDGDSAAILREVEQLVVARWQVRP